jgi:hypothetical protein
MNVVDGVQSALQSCVKEYQDAKKAAAGDVKKLEAAMKPYSTGCPPPTLSG